jgi:hypothetical protein
MKGFLFVLFRLIEVELIELRVGVNWSFVFE